MKNVYLLLFFFAFATSINAQKASKYNFTVKSGVALEDITSGATTIVGSGKDDESSAVIDMPFTFRYSDVDYNQFSASSNGLFGLGATPVDAGYFDYALIQTSTYPVLSPWCDDLLTAVNGGVKYKVVLLSSGLRKLVIEWNVRNISDRSTTSFNKKYQVWLFESSNKVQFVYGSASDYKYDNSTIGIAGEKTEYICVSSGDNIASNTNPQFISHIWPGNEIAYIFNPSFESEIEPIVATGEVVVKNVRCNGEGNGSIALGSISGGDGNYTISWTGPDNYVGSSSSISALKAGKYKYTITDGANTTPVMGEVEITEPAALTLTATPLNVSCNGGSKISVATNGSYTIKDESGSDVTNQTEFAPGVYSIVATQTNAGEVCTTKSVQVVIEKHAPIDASVSIFPEYTVEGQKKHTIFLGYGAQSVTLTTNIVGGSGSHTYSWYPATGLSDAYAASPIASPTVTTTYTFTVTDVNGCSVAKSVTVNVIDARCGDKVAVCKEGKLKCVEQKQVKDILENERSILGPCNSTFRWQDETTSEITAYPNPSTGVFWVELNNFSTAGATLFVMNEHGKIISGEAVKLNGENQKVRLNLSNQGRGWYYIKVVTAEGVRATKVFLIR